MRFIRLIVIVFSYITQRIGGMKKSQIMQAVKILLVSLARILTALSSAWPFRC